MSSVTLVEGMIDLIAKNFVAKTNVSSDVMTGDVIVNVENAFHFDNGQEVVLIDYGYNDPASPHYQMFEYARIKEVNNTHYITLTSPVVDETGWLAGNGAFVQKTIGHAPLYEDRIFYGDREVISTEEMAVTVEPLSMSNEWIYLHGGLSEEYRVSIMIYSKEIETEEGMKILNKYADNMYVLFNKNIHIDVNNYDTQILENIESNTSVVVIADTPENREKFVESRLDPDERSYAIQDNMGTEIDLSIESVDYYNSSSSDSSEEYGKIYLTMRWPFQRSYSTEEFGVFRKFGMYFYDTRVDNIEFGMVQKGSAFVRAARLNWFGKIVSEYNFPQKSQRVDYLPQVVVSESSSSSS